MMQTRTEADKIRQAIKDAGLYQYNVCDHLGITEPTLIRWLRKPQMLEDKQADIYDAIEKAKKERDANAGSA